MPWLKYIKEIEQALLPRNATEHTYRPALKSLLETIGKKVTATNEPRREKCGAPDYVISQKNSYGAFTIGYVEAKDVGKRLDEVERSEQLTRYRTYLPNLILTDYLEFRWYVEGKPRCAARLARVGVSGKLQRTNDGVDAVKELLCGFLEHKPAPIVNPETLAQHLARLTHMIRDIIIESIKSGHASSTLLDLRKAFAVTLIPDLDQPEKISDFADMYAQTIAYGLFAARCNHNGPRKFQRLGAASEIPKTNPFLRKLFETITGTDLDEEPYAGFVDDVASLLAQADMEAVLKHFGKRERRQDPVVHFYETFLAAYDPKLQKSRGVYYTPEPVVSYIVNSVDHILKRRFGCEHGLADKSVVKYKREDGNGKQVKEKSPRVLILDPACGTGTFLYAVVDHIREQFMAQNDAGMWSGYVKNHLLPRLFGFELLMAPYAVAHFKLGMQLAGQDMPSETLRKKWAYNFEGGKKDRLKVYMTNTLEGIERTIPDLFGWYKIISDEANEAREIKRDLPIMVVMGNPPYRGHSANRSVVEEFVQPGDTYTKYTNSGPKQRKAGKKGVTNRIPTFIGKLIQDYYKVDGKPLGEKNPKWLQDDYVKFLRWGTWRIEQTGAGILAFITNHSYLDNPTFRGMRQHLMNAFTDIYVVDLHGNTKKKEKCPNGSKDENVFDIQQGVSIGIFVKEPGKKSPCKVRHCHVWGTREQKYSELSKSDITTNGWTKITPSSPEYLFVTRAERWRIEYESGWKITDIFPLNSVGVVTARDKFTISMSKKEVWDTVRDFVKLTEHEAREKYILGQDAKDWNVGQAQLDIKQSGPVHSHVVPILYRPFDIRFTYFTGKSRGFICRPRHKVMRHILGGQNLGLVTTRQTRDKWDCLATRIICGHKSCAAYDINTLFPLYLYPDPVKDGDLFTNGTVRHVNLNPNFLQEMGTRLRLSFVPDGTGDLKKSFGPDDVFHYIYAILHSPTYRERYSEFLKNKFPRVPITGDKKLFRTLCSKGKDLVELHLLDSPKLTKSITSYPVTGDNIVAQRHPRYFASGEPEPGTGKPLKKGRVYISSDSPNFGTKGQYFDGVPTEIWEFHVGGYQVCEKWLKDRRGRKLSYEDLIHYQRVVISLKQTIQLMQEIDTSIPQWPI